MASTDTLFRPFSLGSLSLPNRIVMAPMTRTFSPEGVPGENVAEYYARRAGSVGLIISEGTVIDRPNARNDPKIPFFHGEAPLGGWKRVIDAVHAEGGHMAPQIWHTGAMKYGNFEPGTPVESPSGLIGPGKPRGEAMSEAAIADTIAAFGRAAGEAKALGFDTVELHGAHGYLIDEFFWAGSNVRTDRWGGATIAERSRFAVEAIRAVRAAVGPDMPVIIRLSQWKQQDYAARLATTPAEMEAWLAPLVAAGANVLHCSQRRFWEPEFPEIDGGNGLNFAGWAKKLTGAATISVGSVGLSGEFMASFRGESSEPASLDALLERMERDEFDLIAVGRALITDPHWVDKVRDGRTDELRPFNPAALAELV